MPPDEPEIVAPAAPPAAPAIRALTCPSCGGTVTLRAAGYTVTVVCLYCGSALDVSDPEVKLIAQYQQAALDLVIPLGTRGMLKGVEWEAVGYLEKSENDAFFWSEILLFNPYHGYRWLVTDGRGWSFGTMLTRTPGGAGQFVVLDDRTYEPFFADGRSRVDYVLGEFYWRVAVGETVDTSDWVRPGWMLSREANENEESWTLSELLDPKEMHAGFGVGPPDNPWPPLPHQPSPYSGDMRRFTLTALAAAAFIFLLYIVMGSGPKLAETRLAFAVGAGEGNATVGPVTLSRPWQFVSIEARAPGLDNSWLDLDYSLVERGSQRSWQAYGVAERYSGYDSDGSWTEGSRASTVKIAAVPKGTYDLVVDYSATRWGSSSTATAWDGFGNAQPEPSQEAELVVRSGGFFGSNLLLALGLILLPLALMAWRHIKFEQARQEQSDFGTTGVVKLVESMDDDESDEEDDE